MASCSKLVQCIVYGKSGGHVSFVAKLVWCYAGPDKGAGWGKTTLGIATFMWTSHVEQALKLAGLPVH